jgi:hypothetical protein
VINYYKKLILIDKKYIDKFYENLIVENEYLTLLTIENKDNLYVLVTKYLLNKINTNNFLLETINFFKNENLKESYLKCLVDCFEKKEMFEISDYLRFELKGIIQFKNSKEKYSLF